MSVPRRHHILPVVYQKHFSDSSGKVWVHDKITGKSFTTSPKNVSVRRDYNTVLTEELSLDHSVVEQFFSVNEAGYPATVNALRSGVQAGPELTHATQFMMLQASRSPNARALMGNLLLKMSPKNIETLKLLGVDNTGIELLRQARSGNKEAEQRIGLQSSFHLITGMAQILDPLWYRPIRLESERVLCSGDGPVIYFGVERRRKKLSASLPKSGVRVLCCFPMANNLFIFGDSQKPPSSAFLTDQPSQSSDSLPLVKAINTAVALCSQQTVISGDRNALFKTVTSIPKKPSPNTLINHFEKLGKELLKLNRSRWGRE